MKRKILVAEDNAINRLLLHHILHNDYEVIDARDGSEAMEVLRRQYKTISAVLLDIEMPLVNGFEVLRQMRASTALAQIPVIVATASQDEETEIKALALGANDYVTKPYSPPLMLHCLRNTINLRENASIVNAIQRDKLTGLYNREAFFHRVNALIREREPGYFLLSCFDVDNFKLINDQYGAEEGDRILRHIGKTLGDVIRTVDGLCGRISADNFVALYPAKEKTIEYLDQMRTTAFIPSDARTQISFSVGRYVITDPSLSASTIYDRAYLAKRSVKGRYDAHIAYFDDSMLDKLVREQAIINEMKDALAKGQFEAWFQPQFNHATGALIGAEALVRWRHPQRGLIPPYEFIPLFEQSGFVYELDQHIWRQVCQYLHKWIAEGRDPLPLSVNISRYDIFRADFIDVLTALMEEYQIPVDLLRIEITESAFAESSEQIINVVKQLIQRGFTVEIDDFGSGYSSLNTLKDVPASVLKLDMRFLEDKDNAQRSGNILESIVRMAKWLNMSVIAEGAEDVEQADFLQSIGCNYIQGYLYGKPMPLREYEALAGSMKKERRLIAMEAVKNLDNNAFWNPRSMDTLIFNSYVGGACIFEYHNGSMEMLRVNDKFAKGFGYADMSVEEALRLKWAEYLDAESANRIRDAIGHSSENNEDATTEIMFQGLPNRPPKIFLRSTYRVIASAGERRLVYCTNENITEKKLAEQALQETDENLRFLNDVAHDLLAQPDSNRALQAVLQKLLGYFGGNRAYIFETNEKTRTASSTYEVCAPGVARVKDSFQSIPFNRLGYWRKSFETEDHIIVADVEEMIGCQEATKDLLRGLGIQSFIAVPLKREGEIIGVIGIENPTQQRSRIDRMAALGDYVAVMLTRRDLEGRVGSESKALLEFMNDIPGGFARMRVEPDGGMLAQYYNEGFYKLVGMDREQARELYGGSVLDGVHPDDVSVARDALHRILKYGEATSSKHRLRTGNGECVWVTVFGRATKNPSGQVFVNLYFTKAVTRLTLEEERRRFLDDIPCGAGMYQFNGDTLTELYLNQKYRDMLGRPHADPSHVSLLNPMHPDDKASLIREIQKAVSQNRDAVHEVRILYGNEDSYRMYHFLGRAIPREDGMVEIVATYTPTEGDASAYQEMLPVALNAVVGACQDMAFVKDRFLRYVCCNRAFVLALGLKDETEVIGKTDYDLLGKAYADQYRAGEKQILKTGRARLDFDETLPTEDGAARYVSTSKYPLLDAGNNVIGIFSVSRDMTKAHNADSQLKLLTDSIPGGLATYRCTPGKAEATYFNEGCVRMLGYTQSEYERIAAHNTVDLIDPEDAPALLERLHKLLEGENNAEQICRVRAKDGSVKWINYRVRVTERAKDMAIINAVLLDVTELQESMERLRISEEENRLAVKHSGNAICRLNMANRTLAMSMESAQARSIPECLVDVPYGQVRQGMISSDTTETYIAFYEQLYQGAKTATAIFQWRKADGWHWLEARASTIFTADGQPLSAVVSFADVTDRMEKEAVYKRWTQSLKDQDPANYMLFRCNLTKNTSLNSVEGSLLTIVFSPEAKTFDARTQEYLVGYVAEEDRERYAALLQTDTLLTAYYRGQHNLSLEYREKTPEGGRRWLRVNIDLVEYPNSCDVEAYMMYTDIDQEKRAALEAIENAEKDPLTGALNRLTFVKRVEERIAASGAEEKHALMMLDVDGFKLVNDFLGHDQGDQTLIDIVTTLRSVLRRDDLLGRLGGDEFVVFMSNIPDDGVIAGKAKRISELVRKSYGVDVQISFSIGIAVYPRDGASFDALYKKADSALYRVKDSGKDSYAFFCGDGQKEGSDGETSLTSSTAQLQAQRRKRMLVIDNNDEEIAFLTDVFKDEYAIEKGKDINSALIRLRHYGAAIAVVVLSLSLPGEESFLLLEKMQAARELSTVPVLVIGDEEDREISLKAFRAGASCFLGKPLDPELMRIRTAAVISNSFNERQRVRNRYQNMEFSETAKYRLVLERTHTALIVYEWLQGVFSYDDTVQDVLAGHWDSRTLWHILLADLVAEVSAVKALQELVHRVAENRVLAEDDMTVRLKVPDGGKHWFRVDVYKVANEYQLTERLILTFRDLGTEKPLGLPLDRM